VRDLRPISGADQAESQWLLTRCHQSSNRCPVIGAFAGDVYAAGALGARIDQGKSGYRYGLAR
jgi:hypothetical protein